MTQRTQKQNKAIHKYFELLAEALNDAGYDMKKTLKEDVDIPWNKDMVKSFLWKTIQEPMIGEKSTTDLDTDEVDKVYKVLSRHISEKFGVYVPFPSDESLMNK